MLHLLGRTGPGVDDAYRDALLGRFEVDTSKRGSDVSTGNRQKVALVAAFATRAPLLVLDEPTSGLDPLMEREFRRAVGEARHGPAARRDVQHAVEQVGRRARSPRRRVAGRE